ncbi:MAG: GspE/PulE family protein [Planctomycetota bacterium]|jgi:type IV pilus assembly protein PilB
MPVADADLIQALLVNETITEADADRARDAQSRSGGVIRDSIVALGILSEDQIAETVAGEANLRFIHMADMEIAPAVIETIPQALAKRHSIVPVERTPGSVLVACAEPLDFETTDNLRFILNSDVEFVVAPKDELTEAINRYYGGATVDESVDSMLQEFTDSDIGQVATDKGASTADMGDEDAPVVKLVRLVIEDAVRGRASDVHVEPMTDRVRVRYRVDGLCHEVQSVPKRLQGAIISRLKIMSKMDIAEKRRPQDGRILMRIDGRDIDFRVSALPATHGESVVLRILDKEKALIGLDKLGFDAEDSARFSRIIRRPNGVFLVTGPTGSGKTTTLYAALSELNRPDVKIISAEDPVEYNLAGINQCQVHDQIGLTFARILRSILRQAPNIILIGEIRAFDVAEVAVQAALTGHLVFSTLHTNDAPSAITRLIDMGVKPFLVASSIQAIMGQRLIRRICERCREPITPDPRTLQILGLKEEDIEGSTFYQGRGCPACNDSGFKGRQGIFELMEMNPTVREMAFKKTPVEQIRQQAVMTGMLTLKDDGMKKAKAGVTTLEEVMRITVRGEV